MTYTPERFQSNLRVVTAPWRWLLVALSLVSSARADEQILISIESASSLTSTWSTINVTEDMITTNGALLVGSITAAESLYYRLNISLASPVSAGTNLILLAGGTLPPVSGLSGTTVESFVIASRETTWGEWRAVRDWAALNGYDIGSSGMGSSDDHPVESVNWYEIVKWCNARSEMEGFTPCYQATGGVYRTGEFGFNNSSAVSWTSTADGYRLPTEAEWEWAAQGALLDAGFPYSGSTNVDEVAWYRENSSGALDDMWEGRGTWPVESKAANQQGLYDMSGNVWEWVWDRTGEWRGVRGGSWYNVAANCHIRHRPEPKNPENTDRSFGFRIVRNAPD